MPMSQQTEMNMLLHGQVQPSQSRLTVALQCTAALCAMAAAWTVYQSHSSNTNLAVQRVLPSTNTAATRAMNPYATTAGPLNSQSGMYTTQPMAAQQAPEFQETLYSTAIPQSEVSSVPQGAGFFGGVLATVGALLGLVMWRQRRDVAPQLSPMAMAATSGEKFETRRSLWHDALGHGVARKDLSLDGMTNRIGTLENQTMALRGTKVRKNYAQKNGKFLQKLDEVFPGSMTEMEFVAKTTKLLNAFGFNKDNSIPMVCLCRDELTRDLIDEIEEQWGLSFSMGSIAGMAYMGKTGMYAGMAHSPQCGAGVERYVFVSAPHIAIDADGNVGQILREGRAGVSGACGALQAMLGELQRGGLNLKLETIDLEQTMMKQQLTGFLEYGKVPTLADLTKAAQKLIKSQIESILKEFDLTNKEYAFVSGVQIHGPDALNFFQITDFYVKTLDGSLVQVELPVVREIDASDILDQAAASDLARALFNAQKGDLGSLKRWVEAGNDVDQADSEGRTCLQTAARFGHPEVVKYLLQEGANPNLKCINGRVPLQEAVRSGHDDCAQILYDRGSVLPYEVAAFYLWRAAREGKLNLAKRAVKFGPKDVVNTRNAEGDSPLLASVRLNNLDVSRYLIAMGADTKGMDMDGNTLEKLAERRGVNDLVAEDLKGNKQQMEAISGKDDNVNPLFSDND